MAAPHIPNLLSSRLTRTPGRGRGRSRGGNAIPPQEDSTVEKADNDRIVQQTDQDASSSRVSAVDVGYLEDPFAKDFAAQGQLRKFPIINRGTWSDIAGVFPYSLMLVSQALISGPRQLTVWSTHSCSAAQIPQSRSSLWVLDPTRGISG